MQETSRSHAVSSCFFRTVSRAEVSLYRSDSWRSFHASLLKASPQLSGSRVGLRPPSPLRTVRTSFPVHSSSKTLANQQVSCMGRLVTVQVEEYQILIALPSVRDTVVFVNLLPVVKPLTAEGTDVVLLLSQTSP